MAHLIGAAHADLPKRTARRDPIQELAENDPLYGCGGDTAGVVVAVDPVDALYPITHGHFEGRADDRGVGVGCSWAASKAGRTITCCDRGQLITEHEQKERNQGEKTWHTSSAQRITTT